MVQSPSVPAAAAVPAPAPTPAPARPAIEVTRRSERFAPEHRRVITKFFRPGTDDRVRRIIGSVLALDEETVRLELSAVLRDFEGRHRTFRRSLLRHFGLIASLLPHGVELTDERRLLLGAYFTSEYSISAAAMFNPSIVPDPDQTKLSAGAVRFIMSFRATGEGHIASIEFRSGTIDANGEIAIEPASPFLELPEVIADSSYEKRLFALKVAEMGADNEVSAAILGRLPEHFTMADLEREIASLQLVRILPGTAQREATEAVRWLARSNYTVRFPSVHGIAERVIFPSSENESRGVEDARFVRFEDETGPSVYYATYTAYNGVRILPQLIETGDFVTFKVLTLNGRAARGKGMALFPRRIGGKYAMIGRQDGESLTLMFSDNIHFWQEARSLRTPRQPWELVQIGNNGAPIETEAGWLLLTHGVGPLREYCMGCMLLDLNDPSRVIGSLKEPLMTPSVEERDGYVPNVLYSCGAMIHRQKLIIPYAMSDSVSGIATVSVDELLARLTESASV